MKKSIALVFFITTVVFTAVTFTTSASAQIKPPQNEGGMWMPSQMPDLEQQLREMGIRIDPKELSDPSSNLLKAIVSLGGCSASFISADGLMITNHHCVEKILSYLTNIDNAARESKSGTRWSRFTRAFMDFWKVPVKDEKPDYVKTGFLARAREDERSAGPAQKIYITTKIIDVTDQVFKGTERVQDPGTRARLVEKNMKELIQASEKANPFLKTEVKSFFRQEQYFLIERLKLDDIRLVYAPPHLVGTYGGDAHNWRWPRYTGDFALLRAYVSPEGNPAEYSEQNVPYKPEKFFEVSRQGIKPDDLVLVAGYPGSTTRLQSAQEFRVDVEVLKPRTLSLYQEYLEQMDALGQRNEGWKKKLASARSSASNAVIKFAEGLKAIQDAGVVRKRQEAEDALIAWVNADEQRRVKYGKVFDQLVTLQKKYQSTDDEIALSVPFSLTSTGRLALELARKSYESSLPDSERRTEYQERNWKMIWESHKEAQARLDAALEIEMLSWTITRAVKRVSDKVSATEAAWLDPILGQDWVNNRPDAATVRAKVEAFVKGTRLYDLAYRERLFNMPWEEIQREQDPVVQWAVRHVPEMLKSVERLDAAVGEFMLIAPHYVQARREFRKEQGKPLAPDANLTLRITFGKVLGTDKYAPFTSVGQMIAKEHIPETADFEVPQNVREAYKTGDLKAFSDPMYGDIPLNFLANVDTTGGNSGSAALDAEGRLIGLLFDGMKDKLYGDWYFDDDIRSILLDIRYFLWTLQNVEKADALLKEMKIVPQCSESLGGKVLE